jgi:hypothetical protein
MVRTNLQEFAGDVHVLSNLQVGSNLFANDLAANVLNVIGSIGANLFVGDGGLLSNIATTLDDIIDQGNTVSNTIIFVSGNDATSNTGIITRSNVGISISNTEPTGEYQLTVGSNIFVNTHASNVLTVVGRIGSDYFVGDGGLLSNIATTLDQIVDQGNTISNTVILESGQDSALTSNIGLVSRENVGISVSNSNPTGEFQFGVGSNLFVNTYSSNVLTVEGNVLAQKLTFGTATVTSAYNLSHVTAQGSVTDQTISLTNATTGLAVTSNATVGGNVTAETVISTANVEVGDRLKFASNVFVDDLRVADVAANLVTYDKTTGELMDSGGLFANKLAVVSVQPPSALSANTTTIAKHGTYTVTTSGLAEYSNAWNAFDGDSAVEWTSPVTYGEGDGVYSGTSNLFAGNYIQTGVSSAGEWLAIEFPYKTTLRHMKLTPPATATSYPTSANVYATNDSLTWTEVVNWSDVNPVTSSNVQTIIVNATESFKKYAMVVTKAVGTTTSVALAKWDLFTESFSIDGGKVEMASSAVMGGETTMDQHGPHSRDPKAVPLKKYPERVKNSIIENQSPIGANTFVYRSFTLSSSTTYASVNHNLSNAVDDDEDTAWSSHPDYDASGDPTSTDFPNGHYIQIELPNKIRLKNTMIQSQKNTNFYNSPKNVKIYGSDDGLSWALIKTATNLPLNGPSLQTTIDVDSTNYYKYHRLEINNIYYVGGTYGRIAQWELYGYEEDPPAGDTSVDTTFTSIMNTPQTTGANVYVDGSLGETFTNRVTGPDATGPSATYDATGKYWELNGTLTSNIAVEANTFLEGDAPHSVSVWFNSSNLEANVSNTCVFSVSDQEKLDSVNLDLQSNTWHNLTYAYQGEGGSRVTYLDGRKVAEDQAEDTFGDYPPFAMTGNSQGGYVVSASSLRPSHQAWHAFDKTKYAAGVGEKWASEASQGDTFTGGNSLYDGTNRLSSSTPYGAWLKIELPHKIRLQYISLFSDPTTEQPKDFIIYGSNDDNTWDQLFQKTGATENADYVNYTINSVSCYKYFGLVIRRLISSTTIAAIDEWKLYGHRENDLVRLPDPTNVLKYPHIAMTGPAQRGYVAKVSSQTSTTVDYPYIIFDGDDTTQVRSAINTYTSGIANTTDNLKTQTSAGGTATINGSWISIELPHKLILQSTRVVSNDGDSHVPKRLIIYGSNDITNDGWTEVDTTYESADANIPYAGTGKTWTTTSSSTGYKNFALAVSQIENGTGNNRLVVSTWELYGTGVDSVPIQIGGGNIDKVANFRVYDKFVGEDQALEIWDAQKDEFGRAKSSMTLHKGRLGIGTTEPEGRLAVLDEPHNLEEFPPRAMTGYKNYFEGHGEFCVSASSYYTLETLVPWNAFDHVSGTRWAISDTAGYTSGAYTGSDNFTTNGGYVGEWIQIEAPYPIKLSHVMVNKGVSVGRGPAAGYILGSNNGIDWDVITNFTGKTYSDNTFTTIEAPATSAYRYLRMVVTNVTGGTMVDITELRYFGTREQGQSVLHDGQLTLTKSLNVPRIGPALDADDTPRRDRLVVEYNTSTNPTFEGAVRDTSGRGNDGVFYGGAYYDATEKSLEVPGTRGIIRKNINLPGGNIPLSASAWIKGNNWNTSLNDTIVCLGTNSTATGGGSFILRVNTDQMRINFEQSSNYTEFSTTITNGRWYHVVATYDGGTSASGRKLFIDGVEIAQTSTDGTITGVNLPVNPDFAVGMRTDISGYINGSISNFKLYDTALTAEEVKTLYDMGRCDEGHHVVNFSKTRVGIGLGDGEAPRGALDVRESSI